MKTVNLVGKNSAEEILSSLDKTPRKIKLQKVDINPEIEIWICDHCETGHMVFTGERTSGWTPINYHVCNNCSYRSKTTGENEIYPRMILEEKSKTKNIYKNLKKLVAIQEKYIEILVEELNETAFIAGIHGWRSSRVTKGKDLLKELEVAKEKLNEM